VHLLTQQHLLACVARRVRVCAHGHAGGLHPWRQTTRSWRAFGRCWQVRKLVCVGEFFRLAAVVVPAGCLCCRPPAALACQWRPGSSALADAPCHQTHTPAHTHTHTHAPATHRHAAGGGGAALRLLGHRGRLVGGRVSRARRRLRRSAGGRAHTGVCVCVHVCVCVRAVFAVLGSRHVADGAAAFPHTLQQHVHARGVSLPACRCRCNRVVQSVAATTRWAMMVRVWARCACRLRARGALCSAHAAGHKHTHAATHTHTHAPCCIPPRQATATTSQRLAPFCSPGPTAT
jgi:hypothetical protein